MIDTKKIYTSNNDGNFKIVRYVNNRNVDIEFVATKYRTTVQLARVNSGSVKDVYHPSIYGVGFIGYGYYKSRSEGRVTKQYLTWKNMLRRCYCPKYHNKNPTYKGCHVAIIWHNFQEFAKWFDLNYVAGFELDKDIKLDGNKLYSPTTCLFVDRIDNNAKAHAKNYSFKSPLGVTTFIYNLAEFCRKTDLCSKCMMYVHSGKQKNHKGWEKYNERH